MLGMIKIDGKSYLFMGKTVVSDEKYFAEPDVIEQTSVDVQALNTTYTFENETVTLTVNFLTPLLLNELAVLSRPIDEVYQAIWRFISETRQRVPISDWYYSSTAEQANFQNRTVLGGIFVNLL